MKGFLVIWRNLRPLTISLFVQFTAPLLLVFLIYLLFVILSAIKLFSIPWLDLLSNRFYFLNYQWYPFSVLYFLSGPIFAVALLYFLLGKKKSLLLLFPLSFYILYFLPLILGNPFPPVYDKINNYQPGNLTEVRHLSENTKINGFTGSAIVVSDSYVWKIDNGKISRLTDNSYVYDFSASPLLVADNERYLISSDYSGSIIFDLQKQTKVKIPYRINSTSKNSSEVIAEKITGSDAPKKLILELKDLTSQEIKTASAGASFIDAAYLNGTKLILTYTPDKNSYKRVAEIDGKIIDTPLINQFLQQSTPNQWKSLGDKFLFLGSFEKNGIVTNGIWSFKLTDTEPHLLYTPEDGSGIRSFSVDKQGMKLVAIKLKSNTDQGSAIVVDLDTGNEAPVPMTNILTKSVTAPKDQQFTGIGWMMNGQIWIASTHRSYNNYTYQASRDKKDIWFLNQDGSGATTVVTDADNYLFLD